MDEEEQIAKREFYPNRPLAQTVANRLQRKYEEAGCYSATCQLEPNKGFVVALHCENNIPDAWDDGAVVYTRQFVSDPKQDKPKTSTTTSANPSAPKGGTTARVWVIADEQLEKIGASDIKVLRSTIIATCDGEGINKSTAGTQYSKWKKAKNIT